MIPVNLKRPAFHVLMAPEGVDPDTAADEQLETHHVVVHAADQLRAELEAGKLGIASGGKDRPMAITMLWLWAAMVRTGAYTGKWATFKTSCVAFNPDKKRPAPPTADGDDELDELDAVPTVASTG